MSSLFSPLPLMGRLKLGYMIAWGLEWIMMLPDFGVRQWLIALMELGKNVNLLERWYFHIFIYIYIYTHTNLFGSLGMFPRIMSVFYMHRNYFLLRRL